MKVRFTFLLTLLLLLIVNLTPAQDFGKHFCFHADDTCRAQARDRYTSCKILGGNEDVCTEEADNWYVGCMGAHGCQPIAH